MSPERTSIIHWLERLADRHEAKAKSDSQHAAYHRHTATLYRARVSDIAAEVDIQDTSTTDDI